MDSEVGMEQEIKVICDECGQKGPPGPFSPEARAAAEAAGWLVGYKSPHSGRRPDYCPECRQRHEVRYCQSSDKTGPCGLPALYELVTVKDDKVYGCGKHYGALMRDIFNSQPNDPLTVWRIRKAHINSNEQ